jgi:methyl-accepting chemotaxis protein
MNLQILMRSFTIRVRMLGAIGVVFALLALVGGAGLFGMLRVQHASADNMGRAYAQFQALTTLRTDMNQVRRLEKDMIIGYEKPEQVKELHGQWQEGLSRVARAAAAFAALAGDEDKAVLAEVGKRVQTYGAAFEGVARQLEASGYDNATVANRVGRQAVASFDEAEKALNRLDTSVQARLDQSGQAGEAVVRQTEIMFAVALLLAALIVAPLTILNMQSICEPVEQARRMAQATARGDLSLTMAVHGTDETAHLQQALLEMQHSLRGMVSQMRETSDSIATASQEIASGNQDLSGRTEQTAGNVQQTVSSMTQLTGNVQQTASSAQTAHQLVASASDAATRGGAVVEQVVSNMQDISASSHKIAAIIGVIDGIAFQTNILALNAAVEAARAGEQGRGFAVVASEVRALAQRSAGAANEIKTLIGTSVSNVESGARLVSDAGATMREIVYSVQRVSDVIGEITAAAVEQSSGIGQVNLAVNEIDEMTQQNAALVEESAAAAESLKDQAQRLSQAVGQFNLGAMHTA